MYVAESLDELVESLMNGVWDWVNNLLKHVNKFDALQNLD